LQGVAVIKPAISILVVKEINVITEIVRERFFAIVIAVGEDPIGANDTVNLTVNFAIDKRIIKGSETNTAAFAERELDVRRVFGIKRDLLFGSYKIGKGREVFLGKPFAFFGDGLTVNINRDDFVGGKPVDHAGIGDRGAFCGTRQILCKKAAFAWCKIALQGFCFIG